MKIALVSHVLPPSWSGQAMMIYRVLANLDPDSYSLFSTRASGIDSDPTHYLSPLPGPRHQIPSEFVIRRGFRYGTQYVNFGLALAQRARFFIRMFKQQDCDTIVACTGDVLDIPAAYIASRRLGLPFFAYIFDHYSKREWVDPVARAWATRLEPWVMKGAAGIIVPNEILRDDLRINYGVEATVIHNSCDISAYEMSKPPFPTAKNGAATIAFTGDIYEAHLDAFNNLLSSIKILSSRDIKLHLYTARRAEDLETFGIRGPIVLHPHHRPSEMPAIQQRADILFLPLAFDSPYPELIRTSSTAKLAEYLAARRPVLVHAPPDSFISWYFKNHECGVVIDKLDPVLMSTAIERLLSDVELQQRLSENAGERARVDFDIVVARAQFMKILEVGRTQKSNPGAHRVVA
jgi:glycosyltransferase involved in cell wall biosynthesis